MPASPETNNKKRKRLVLFVEEGGGDWHARQLVAAFNARGHEVVTTTLTACAFDTRLKSGLDIPGFDGQLPDGVFVRAISTGSLEQITFRLGILHALRASGVMVWNDARTIERCVDKSTATFLFQNAGLPVPTTRVMEGRERAFGHAEAIAKPLVIKPLFGSQGNGVLRANSPDELPCSETVGQVYYLQHYLRDDGADTFADMRVFVSKGRVLASMAREGAHWVTNVHQGGKPAPLNLTEDMSRLALGAVKAVGADYAGVDLIQDPNSGRLLVLEINSNPAWKGLYSVSEVDIAAALADDFLATLRENTADG
ncbi:MAG: RimK family alpha-L-glutamate ligase [Alphaproteobacteria bacterium]|nr:RimK family alpha-L-glutamate ligase [Alphaproteobacteria bacterium]